MAGGDAEDRFANGIVKLLRYFNLIDTNVGLCLSHLTSPHDPEAAYPRLAKQTSQQRFDELNRLVVNGTQFSTNSEREEFDAWFKDATRARLIRNRYVHGNWEYLPRRSAAPVGVWLPAWMAGKPGQDTHESMTLEQLEDTANEVENIFERFREIRRRHEI